MNIVAVYILTLKRRQAAFQTVAFSACFMGWKCHIAVCVNSGGLITTKE